MGVADTKFIQAKANASGAAIGAASWALAFDADVAQGNFIIIHFEADISGSPIITVTDTRGCTFSVNFSDGMIVSSALATSGPDTVTLHVAGTGVHINSIAMAIAEYKNLFKASFTYPIGGNWGLGGVAAVSQINDPRLVAFTSSNGSWKPSTAYGGGGQYSEIVDTSIPPHLQDVSIGGTSGLTPPLVWSKTGGNTPEGPDTLVWNDTTIPAPTGACVTASVGVTPYTDLPALTESYWTLRASAHTSACGIAFYDKIGLWQASYSVQATKTADNYRMQLIMIPSGGYFSPPVPYTYPTSFGFASGSGILTPIFDNGTPRQRKDSYTIRGKVIGTMEIHVITDLSGEITIGTLATGTSLVDFILDLQTLIDVAAGTNKHPTWYQVHIINYGPVFTLSDLEIFFEERPIPLTFKRGYNKNFGSSSPKRLRAQPYTIDTLGEPVTYTPIIDGAAGTPVTFNTNEKLTVQWSPSTDIFATDFGYTMTWAGTSGFELWEDQQPAILQILPQGFLFYQVGPQDLFRYGRIQGFEFRVYPTAGITSIPFTLYLNDNIVTTGSITVIPLKENTVYVETLKAAAGSILRIEFGPTTPDPLIFYPYYVRAKASLSGTDANASWIPL